MLLQVRFVHLKDILESPPTGESSDSQLASRVALASALPRFLSFDFAIARRRVYREFADQSTRGLGDFVDRAVENGVVGS
jgi:hypothetical protein